MTRKVIIEVRSQPLMFGFDQAQVTAPEAASLSKHLGKVADYVRIDESFSPVTVPLSPSDPSRIEKRAAKALPPHNEAFRAEIDDAMLNELVEMSQDPDDELDGVYIDIPMLEAQGLCPTGPVGNLADVEQALAVSPLHALGLNGNNVLVAVVDSGISGKYLQQMGRTNSIFKGWGYPPETTPATMPVTHGTMTAFDISILAPQATLWDFPIITPVNPEQMLVKYTSDGFKAYGWILNAIKQNDLLTKFNGIVINNSWCMYDLSQDMPVDHPANYSANANHPFNRAVSVLSSAGVDIVFAAGNCGPDCPAGACSQAGRTIYGANSHPEVLCVSAITVTGKWLGYSSLGPGYLASPKPDLCAFSHFTGSQVGGRPDSGTSAAAPIAAGAIAAIRSRVRFDPSNQNTSPAALRAFLQRTAARPSSSTWRPDVGWGVLNGPAIVSQFQGSTHGL